MSHSPKKRLNVHLVNVNKPTKNHVNLARRALNHVLHDHVKIILNHVTIIRVNVTVNTAINATVDVEVDVKVDVVAEDQIVWLID